MPVCGLPAGTQRRPLGRLPLRFSLDPHQLLHLRHEGDRARARLHPLDRVRAVTAATLPWPLRVPPALLAPAPNHLP